MTEIRNGMTDTERAIWANEYCESMRAIEAATDTKQRYVASRELEAIKRADRRVMQLRRFVLGRYCTTDLRQKARVGRTFAYRAIGHDSGTFVDEVHDEDLADDPHGE